MHWAISFVTAVVIGAIYLFWKHLNRKLPSGPYFNPLGRLYGRSGAEGAANLLQLKKNYGDVCCMRVLGTPCVFLNTHEKIRKFYVTNSEFTSGRIDVRSIKLRGTEGRGPVLSDGVSWVEHRRFVLSTLKDLGFGRNGTEHLIHVELQRLIETCDSRNGDPFDPQVSLNRTTCNVIGMLMFGERCGDDDGFEAIYKMIQLSILKTNQTHDLVAVYILKLVTRLPSFFLSDILKYLDDFELLIESKVKRCKRNHTGQVNNFVDAYLNVLNQRTDGKLPSMHTTFCEAELNATIADLFVAGMETTATTLRWGILLMILHQDVQKQVHDELDLVLHGRLPCLSDRKDLVYTDAVLMEVQRFATLTPLGGVHHRCTRTVTIDNYLIPKNSLLHANFYAAHRDESVWPDPYNFNPHNFYKQSSKSLQNAEYLIPFGVGKRSCLGESLAKQEIFILFSGLLQKFLISSPDVSKCPLPEDCMLGNIRIPPPFCVIFRRRLRL